jgi:hypothetical protein
MYSLEKGSRYPTFSDINQEVFVTTKKDGNGGTSKETLLTNNTETSMTERTFNSLTADLKVSLEDLHKYQCGSNEHRASLEKDKNLDPIPHQDIYAAIEVPEGLTKEEQSGFFKAEQERRGHTEETWKEYCEAGDKHADAEMAHNWECYSDIAFSILGILESSACEHCGDTHTGLGRDTDGTAFEYDNTLINLFEVIAFELMNRGEKYEHALYKKSDLLQRLMQLSPEVKTKEVA